MKFKATFFLFLFLFNSVIGLSCALSKDDDGCEEVSSNHTEVKVQIQKNAQFLSGSIYKEICCLETVNAFAILAKLIPQPIKISLPDFVCIFKITNPFASNLKKKFKLLLALG